jgi:hypothetical protein
MPVESKRVKALRYIAEERVSVTSANEHGIRLEVRGSRAEPYHVAYGTDSRGHTISECSCVNGTEYHPVTPKCCHVEVAKLLHRV